MLTEQERERLMWPSGRPRNLAPWQALRRARDARRPQVKDG